MMKQIEQKDVGFIKFEEQQTDPNRAIFKRSRQLSIDIENLRQICQKVEE